MSSWEPDYTACDRGNRATAEARTARRPAVAPVNMAEWMRTRHRLIERIAATRDVAAMRELAALIAHRAGFVIEYRDVMPDGIGAFFKYAFQDHRRAADSGRGILRNCAP